VSSAPPPPSYEELAALVVELKLLVSAQTATIAELTARNAEQVERIAELERQVALGSRNSSKPPSSDGLGKKPAPKSLRQRSGRKPGRAKGDPGGRLEQVADPDVILTVVELEEMGRGREPLFPSRDDARAWDLARRIEDFRVDMAARGGDSESPWLPLIKARIEVIDQVLDEAGIGLSDATRIAYNHSSRQHMEDGVLRTLGMEIDRSNWEFGRHLGHLGPSDQVVSLDHMLVSGELIPGDHLLMLGISPGLNVAEAVVRILAAPSWLSSRNGRRAA
jgi:hypothetical protein